jgi:hypothetical protein
MSNDTLKGLNAHRQAYSPVERLFAETWAEYDKENHILEYLLSDTINESQPVSEDDQVTVATVIQWLGSPVGQGFLAKVLGKPVLKLAYAIEQQKKDD